MTGLDPRSKKRLTRKLANVAFLPCDPAQVIALAYDPDLIEGPEAVAEDLEEAARILREFSRESEAMRQDLDGIGSRTRRPNVNRIAEGLRSGGKEVEA